MCVSGELAMWTPEVVCLVVMLFTYLCLSAEWSVWVWLWIFGPHLKLFRVYSWLLTVLRGPGMVPGIEPELAVTKP